MKTMPHGRRSAIHEPGDFRNPVRAVGPLAISGFIKDRRAPDRKC